LEILYFQKTLSFEGKKKKNCVVEGSICFSKGLFVLVYFCVAENFSQN